MARRLPVAALARSGVLVAHTRARGMDAALDADGGAGARGIGMYVNGITKR